MHPSYSHLPPAIPLGPPLAQNRRRNLSPWSGDVIAERRYHIGHIPFVGLDFTVAPVRINQQPRLSKSAPSSRDAFLPTVNGGVSMRRPR
jgi:hypothetical protein